MTDKKIEGSDRKRGGGLKKAFLLWLLYLAITFVLTILPAGLVGALADREPSRLLSFAAWMRVVTDNVYTMVITQSLITRYQNLDLIQQTREECKVPWFEPDIRWNRGLGLALYPYIFLYLMIVYVAPPWRNGALLVISGLVAAVGLGSVCQSLGEQKRIREEAEKMKEEEAKKEEAEKKRREVRENRFSYDWEMVCGWEDRPAGILPLNARETAGESDGGPGGETDEAYNPGEEPVMK